MKTVQMSFDRAEWTRYYFTVEVDDSLSVKEQREKIIEAVMNSDYNESGTKSLGEVFGFNTEYNFPDELGGPTEQKGATNDQEVDKPTDESSCGPTPKVPEGFIPWRGGECPVDLGAKVLWMTRGCSEPTVEWIHAGELSWWHDGDDTDIVAYKVLEESDIGATPPKPPSLQDFAAQLLTMVRDLNNGYPWKELGISLDKVEETAARLGVTP